MVLTCTLGASLLVGIDRETMRTTLVAAFGCNVAWGIIDAALYVMGSIFTRSRNRRLMQAIRCAPDDATALALVRQAFEPKVGGHGREKDREQFYRGLQGIIAHDAETPSSIVTADDMRSAVAVFVLVVGAAVPSAVPFLLIGDPQLALRVSNAVQIILLFVVGFYWARSIGANGWRTGLVMMLSGVLLVAVAVALGG